MDFQTQKLTIRLPYQDKSIEKVFQNLATAKLAKVLVDMIIRYEDPSNYDECIEALWLDLGNKIDQKTGFPCSSFVISEIKDKAIRRLAAGHYRPIIQN